MKQATATLKRQYVKQWIKLLTQAANKTDDYFFDKESDDDTMVKPYFYGSISFGILITLLIIWRSI